jgi:hypothetical protein
MRFRRKGPAPVPGEAPVAQPSAADALRPLLYGDVPLAEWPPPGGESDLEPWATFVRARDAAGAGRSGEAVEAWLSIARDPDVEARCALQAWTFLRQAGYEPEWPEAVEVLGVVCEIAAGGGHDVLAAYRDGSARYLNHSGRVAVVEEPWPETYAVVAAGARLAREIGLWNEPALPPLPAGHSRVLLLTPGGFRFGQGPGNLLFADPLASSVLDPATALLRRVVSSG